MLMRTGWTIRDALRHRIHFLPDDITAQPPAIRLQSKRHAGGDHEQVLWLRAVRGPHSCCACRELLVISMRLPAAARVAVAKVEPESASVAQYAADLAKHVDQLGDVLLGRRFKADLSGDMVIAQPEIRWRGDTALHGRQRHGVEQLAAIAGQDFDAHDAPPMTTSMRAMRSPILRITGTAMELPSTM